MEKSNEAISFYKEICDGFISLRKTGINSICNDITNRIVDTVYLNMLYADINEFNIDECKSNVITIRNCILKANELFLNGLIGDCYAKIYDLLFNLFTPNKLGVEYSLPKGVSLFRMRKMETQHLLRETEMNHIPFNLRGLIKNQRFSLSGFPCLYLGSSTYLCWEELNRPDFGLANVAAFRNKRKLKLLDLRFPKELVEESDYYRLILAICCSIKSSSPNDTFKSDYIIPQAILHSLIKYNHDVSEEHNNLRYDGIIYTSSHYWSDDKLWKDVALYTNIVIPTSGKSDDQIKELTGVDLCHMVYDLFDISNPCSWNIYNYKQESYTGRSIIGSNVLYERKIDTQSYDSYINSQFNKLSMYLLTCYDSNI